VLIGITIGLFVGHITGQPKAAVAQSKLSNPTDSQFVVLEPEKWIGKRCPLIDYSDIGSELSQGNWIVFLYRTDCPTCEKVVPVLAEKARSNSDTRIAVLAVPPFTDDALIGKVSGFCRTGKLHETSEWFVETPVEVKTQDGIVSSCRLAKELVKSLNSTPLDNSAQ
jgi:hypothetical protein